MPLSSQPEHQSAARAVIYVGLLSDLSLTCIKGAAGLATGSAALLSDSIHSAADMLLSGVTLLATRIAATAPDSNHPFGHGRFDSLGALAVSALLTGAGVTIGIKALDSIAAVMVGAPLPPILPLLEHLPSDALSDPVLASCALAACVASVGIKEVVYRWTMRLGMALRSQALIANAWHHRADSLSSLLAGVGVLGAYGGVAVLDPIAALAVAGMISKAGVEIGYRSVQELMDEALDHDVLQLAEAVAAAQERVVGVQRVRARRMGPSVHIDMEVALAAHETVSTANSVVEEIRSALFSRRPEVAECLVTIITQDKLLSSAIVHEEVPGDVTTRVTSVLLRVAGVKAVSECKCSVALSTKRELHVDARVVLDMKMSLADAAAVLHKAELAVICGTMEGQPRDDNPSWRVVAAHLHVDMKPL